jgi:NADH:ubiquinone oxidoreductase subunit 5 (subunit L)/multisubunit Na+/H+ antiporter MnhA subunit
MFLLAVISVFSGWLLYDFFVGNNWEIFWKDSLFILPNSGGAMDLNLVPSWIQLIPILLTIIGIGIAILFYLIIPSLPILLIDKLKPLYLLSYNKWFLRKFFYFFLVNPLNFIFNLLVLLIRQLIYQVNFIKIKNLIMIKLLKVLPVMEKIIRKYYFIVFLLSILSLFYIDMVFINDF